MSCNTLHLIDDSVISTDVNGIDVTACLAIFQGESLGYPPGKVITLLIEDPNIASASEWVYEGAIASAAADLDPTIFAILTADPPIYSTFTLADGSTITGLAIVPKLTAVQSKLIPANAKPWTGLATAKVGKNCWLWSGRIVSSDGLKAIEAPAPSYVQVIGRVA